MKCFIILSFFILPCLARSQSPVAKFSATPVSGCPPLAVIFSDQSTGNPTSWKWDLGNGTISYQQNPTATYFTPGSYNVTLVVKNAAGSDSITRNQFVQVSALPVANFSASQTAGCSPLRVQFSDNSTSGSAPITSWQWDFGDGSSSTQQHPMHAYTTPGTYTVTLWVTNSSGCVKLFTRTAFISVSEGVSSKFTLNYVPGCTSPAVVTFTNNSTGVGVLNYLWDFGDGTTSTQQQPVHSYSTAGIYSPKLIVLNANGCVDTLVKSNGLNISFTQANFASPSTICEGSNYSFTNTSASSLISSYWSFGDGTFSTDKNPAKTYASAGNYLVKLVTDFGTCRDSIVKNVVVNTKPATDFSVVNGMGCKAPFVAMFNNNTPGSNTYLWQFGDGGSSTNTSGNHTYTSIGNYNVSLTATNSAGCSNTITKTDLIKIAPPVITSLNNLPAKGCLPLTVTTSAVVQAVLPITSYLWNFGDGSTSALPNPSHTYTTEGAFTVKLYITTGAGCLDSLVMLQAVNAGNKPTANFSAAPRDTCAGATIIFKDLSTGAPVHEWKWSYSDGQTGIIKNPTHKYLDTGRFSIELIASSFGCADTITKIEYVHARPPIAAFNAAFTCNDKLTRNFIDKSIGAETWRWDFGDGDTSDVANPSHTYMQPGTYNVIQKVTNAGCEQVSSQSVRVISEAGTFKMSDSIVCRNAPITFDVLSVNTSNIQLFTWFFSGISEGVSKVTSTTPIVVTSPQSSLGTPAVVIKDLLGCSDTLLSSQPIKVYGPTAGLPVATITGCANTSIIFADSSSTDGLHPISQWIWNYGDGNTQTYTTPTFDHIYTTSGNFNVALKVVDSYGCTDSITKLSMASISKPVANFITADTLACPNSTITLIDQSSSFNGSYLWSFGDGTYSDTSKPVHQYAATGSYSIGLKIISPQGCIDSLVKPNYITVDKPVAKFAVSDSFICQPIQVTFRDSSHFVKQWLWSFDNGNNSVLQNPVNVFAQSQIYNVRLLVTSPGGCVDSAFQRIKVSLLSTSLSYNPLQGCSPVPITFTATASRQVDLFWNFGDGSSVKGTDLSLIHTYTTPGKYLPQVIMSDTAGCVVPISAFDTIRIEQINAKFGSDVKFLCDSGTVNFIDSTTSVGAISRTWHFGDGTTSTQTNPSHKYLSPGNYTVKLVVNSPLGCGDSISYTDYVVIDRTVTPTISIKSSAQNICAGTAVTFTASTTNGGLMPTYRWKINGQDTGDSTSFFTTSSIANNDVVSCEFTSSIRCVTARAITSNSIAITVTDYVTPAINVTASSTSICEGTSILFIASQVNGGTRPLYNWQINGTTVSTNNTFTTSALKNGDSVWCKLTSSVMCPTATVVNSKPIGITVYPYPVVDAGQNLLVLDGWYGPMKPTIIATNAIVRWLPSTYLSNDTTFSPLCVPKQDVKYRLVVTGIGGCTSFDEVSIRVLKLVIPNAFSPNGDGINDTWQLDGLKTFPDAAVTIFNRSGQPIFQSIGYRKAWDGTFKGAALPVGVYYYIIDVKSPGVKLYTGSITLLK